MAVIPFKSTSPYCLSAIYVVLVYGISLQFRFIPLRKTNKLIRMTDVKGFTLKNITIQSKDPSIFINDGRDVLFEQAHFLLPGGKVKIKMQGDLTEEPRLIRCLVKEY